MRLTSPIPTGLISRNYQAGHGDYADVLGSLVAVTFYKRFVLAPNYSPPLPAIDWSADDSTVLTAISQVEDEPVRDILNKEFEARLHPLRPCHTPTDAT